MVTTHTFKPSFTGMSCDEMVVDSEGFGDVCGRPASEHVWTGFVGDND